jgi:hypothetical protein
MKENKNIRLLSNEPCHEDAFEGHAHKNIAGQVARIIKDDKERHIIGIEGGWGSGKSNLISLINKDLNGDTVYDEDYDHKNSKYPFFIYDAWGHQSDYQRRAILEELTDDLIYKKQILYEDKWKKKLGELLAKRRKTTTKEVPHLGIGLIMSIIMTVLTPLVVFVVGLIPATLWWVKVLVAVFPYLLGIWYAIHDRKSSLKKNGQDCTIKNIFSELILVYKDQIKENETYTTISEKEPSSTEFKSWMDDVDKDLTSLNKTLIIVFDNMDRLPSQKVESLWSSIHSFFSDKTYNNIKVLIPFDREHVKQAFKNEDAEKESFGNDFINKTFDVVFRVPPPIMRGWQQYMEDMWKKAFGDESELHISVTQIYGALRKIHTPRKIIAFINEMATIKMTMQDVIPDKYIALFIFGKEYMDKDPVGQLLNPDFMGEVKFEYGNDPNTIKYLSALYYQLPVNKALDVVFTKEATDALNNGDSKRLHEIMEHIDLSTILGNAVLKVIDVEKATMALAGLDDYEGYENMPKWLIKIWDDLYQHCKNSHVLWNEIKDYHTTLYRHLFDEDLAEELIKGYLSIDDSKWNAKLYIDTIDKLKVNNDLIDRKLAKYKRKVSPALFLTLLKYTKDKYEDYGVQYDVKELDTYLAGLNQEDVMALEVIPYIALGDNQLPEYVATIEEWLGNTSDLGIDETSILFARLKELSIKPIDFYNYFSDANIYRSWNAISISNPFKYDLLSMRLARKDNFTPAYSAAFDDILESYDDNDAEALAKVIEYYMDYGDLLVQSDYYMDYPLVVEVVEKLTKGSYGTSRANISQCLNHFDQIVDEYALDPKDLLNNLSHWKVDQKSLNVASLPSGLIIVAGEIDNKISKAIHNACEEHYNSQSQDQWKEHILTKDGTYRIWKLYHPKKYQANFDALKSVLKDYASGVEAKQPDRNLIGEWLGICLELKHSVKGLFNDLVGILKKDSAISKAKLLFFGAWLLEYSDIEKQNDFVEKMIPTEIIDSDVIDFIAKHIDKLKNCTISEDFTEKVKHLAQTNMKGNEAIETVCKALKIDTEEIKEEEE